MQIIMDFSTLYAINSLEYLYKNLALPIAAGGLLMNVLIFHSITLALPLLNAIRTTRI